MSPTPPTRIRHPAHRPTWWVLAGVVLLAAALPLATPDAVEGASGWEDVTTPLRANPKAIILDHGQPRLLYDGNTHDTLYFGWCDSGCGDSSSWHSTTLAADLDLHGADLVVDRSGRLHVAYIDLAADGVFYATCATACGDAGSWGHVKVDATNNQVGLTLAIDPWGRPRLSYIRSRPDLETSPKHVFAACDTDCTTPGAWSTVDLGFGGDYPSLAFDGAKPRIAYARRVSPRGVELRYATCEADCFDKRAWEVTAVTWFDSIGQPSLVVEGSRAHIAFNPAGAAATTLAYTRCASRCTDEDHWEDPAFVTPGERAATPYLEISNGRPRIAYMHCEACLTPAQQNHVKYAACNSDCAGEDASGWAVQQIASPARAPSFVLDGERPRVAYRSGPSGSPGDIHYAFCDACGAAGSWPAPPSSPPPASWPPPGSGSGSGGSGGTPDGGAGGSSGSGGSTGTGGGSGGVSGGGAFVGSGGSGGSGGGSGSGSTSSTARESGDDVSAGGAGSVLVDGSGRGTGSRAGAGGAPAGVSIEEGRDSSRGVGEQVSRLPGAAIDVIRNPSQALSWPWARILLKGLALALFGLVGWMTYVASLDRWRRSTA